MDIATTPFGNETWLPLSVIATRLALAIVFGAVVGFEREWRNRPAGLRTHILVCLAATTVALLTIEITHYQIFNDESVRIDPIRLIEAVTSGVAFLAAGVIIFARGEVHGLTTGAGMWLAGAIGLATGLGYLTLAGIVTLLALFVLGLLRILEHKILPDQKSHYPEPRNHDHKT